MQPAQVQASTPPGRTAAVSRRSELAVYAGGVALFTFVFVLAFHSVVAHPGERLPCCVSDGTASIRDYWVARQQGDNPFTFSHDTFNGAPEGWPRSTATVFANAGLQTGFLWGLSPVLGDIGTWNLLVALGLIGSSTAMFALLRRLGCTFVASVFGGYVFGFAPYALERAYAGHLGLLQNWVLVIVVLAMIEVGSRRTVAGAVLAGTAIGLAFWITAYQGLFASLIAFAFAAVDLLRVRRLRTLGLLGVAYGVALVMLTPIFALYANERSTVQAATARSTSDLYTFAARISDYLVPSPRNPLFHWVSGAFSHGLTEHLLFVGYTTVALAIAGVVLLVRHDPWLRSSEARTQTAATMVVLAVIAFLLSLPPSYRLIGLRIPMPSTLLGHFTTNWRVYSRFGEVVGLALVVLAALTLSALGRRPGRAWRWLGPAALAVVVVELFPGNVGAFDTRSGPAWVEWLATQPHGIVATYPNTVANGPATELSLDQLTYQPIDHDPGFQIVGESFLQARSRRQAIRTLAANLRPPLTARILATEGVRYVVVADDVYRKAGLQPPSLDPRRYTLLERLGDVRIYSVHAPRVDLEAAIEAHQPEIAKGQKVILPPPTVAVAGGFNPAEPYNGSTGNWMIQNGEIRVENGDVTPLRVAIRAVAFSNGQPRVLELRDDSGKVVSSVTVPAIATAVSFAPVEVPPGTTHLTLVASPGPDAIGASDPRQASVFLTEVAARPVLNP